MFFISLQIHQVHQALQEVLNQQKIPSRSNGVNHAMMVALQFKDTMLKREWLERANGARVTTATSEM